MGYVYKGTKPIIIPARPRSTPGPKPGPFDPTKCGTRSGYRQHQRKDTDPCQRCKTANAIHSANGRAARAKRKAEQRGGPNAVVQS